MGFEGQRQEITDICRDLFDQNKVSLILGFTSGEPEGSSVPFFMRKPEDIDRLKWDDTCTPNLTKYLTEKKDKLAIIAKPCDSRAIAMYMAEKQIDRSNVYIIGVECAGMKDRSGNSAPGCKDCTVKTPPVYDVLVRNDSIKLETNAAVADKNAEAAFEDKLLRFRKEISKCILCFSCRQACYGCYCDTCFIDRNIPNWLPSELDAGRKMVFHLGRAMHLAGRCVECGACERTCPSGVNIRYLVKDLSDFCRELYGYQAGINADEVPAMTSFSQGDREVGFLGGEDNDSCCHTKGQD